MKLDTYISENGLTDESFGERIGRSRIQVFKYRHGLAVPRRAIIEKIAEVTEGQVSAQDFYSSQPSQHG